MKLSIATFVVLLSALSTSQLAAAEPECQPAAIDFSTDCALVVEKVGQVPTDTTGPFSYNMAAMDNFENEYVFFLDQLQGIIYSHQGDSTVSTVNKVWDMSNTDQIPAGLTLDWEYNGNRNAIYRVKAMTQGPGEEVIVVFTSSTLPVGWSVADATLPPSGSVEKYACRNTTYIGDPYYLGTVPECADGGTGGTVMFTGYDVFYRFHLIDNELVDPVPFLVSETNVSPGHLGGGIATLPDGHLLWSTGDCTVYGLDGSYAPQLEFESCGKILHIDPLERGSFHVAAKGVRNSQQMRLYDQPITGTAVGAGRRRTQQNRKLKYSKDSKSSSRKPPPPPAPTTEKVLAFMDIGGVTAEEVNAFPLERIMDGKQLNFGWGRNLHDGKAREGTFYVNQGKAFVLGTEPSCAGNQSPLGESGFVQPWIQFGRSDTDVYYGICSFAIPSQKEESAGGSMLELIYSEFNTGQLLGTPTKYQEGAAPSTSYKLKIVDGAAAQGGTDYYENVNFLVEREVGESWMYRGDPRLFHFPDGVMGLFMERTGTFYTVTEQML